MKNVIKKGLLLCFIFTLFYSLPAQPNQAKIFQLEEGNIGVIADSVITHLNNSGPISNVPSIGEVNEFLSIPFNNKMYSYVPANCDTPGTRLFLNTNSGEVGFRFDNFGGTQPNSIFISALDYRGGGAVISHAVNGQQIYGGVDIALPAVQFRIFMIGSYCSQYPANPNSQFYSKLEIVIIDKNIL